MSQLNDEDLKAHALRLGAKVVLSDGRVFNASGAVGNYRPKRAAAPAPAAPSAPAATAGMEELVAAIRALTDRPAPAAPEMPAAQITVQPATPSVVVNSATPVSWKFTFQRNDNGTIATIIATPVES